MKIWPDAPPRVKSEESLRANPGRIKTKRVSLSKFVFSTKVKVRLAFEPAFAPPKLRSGLVLKNPTLGEIEMGVSGTGPSAAFVETVRSV